MKNAVSITLDPGAAPSTPDRAPAFSRIDLSPEAAALFIAEMAADAREISLETLARISARAAAASAVIAIEIAGVATAVAREIMRGRRCVVSG